MPLVAHTLLPTFEQLRQSGQIVLTLEHALQQDVRELHIGLLNMMPDTAFRLTEQQFMRLVGSCNQLVQLFVHPFSVSGLPRSQETQNYIDAYYTGFHKLQEDGLDALIITGANVSNPTLEEEPFWPQLKEVISWAMTNVTSVLCSCLATHALVKHLYNIDRQRLPLKRWGVYRHRITQAKHPLLRNVKTRFDVPHSRYNAVTSDQIEAAGLTVLVESVEGDFHMAVSPDRFRIVYFQGHPEYYTNSLLKEYKREVKRFLGGEREDYPPNPEHYFNADAACIADNYQHMAISTQHQGKRPPLLPEEKIEMHLDNTWVDTSEALFNNWLGLVNKITNIDRKVPFITGVNPDDPLDIL